MTSNIFNNVTGSQKEGAIENIIKHSTPHQDFFLMVILSVSMASFGVLLDSTVILIGSMLIAPVLYPTLTLALGLVMADNKIIFRSGLTLIKSIFFALVAGVVIGLFFRNGIDLHNSIVDAIANPKPSILYAVVAAISGLAASFAIIKPNLNDTLPGVAISVSLVPPLAIVGVALSYFDWTLASHAFVLFLVNIAGIVFSAMIVFSLFQLSRKRNVAEATIKSEDRKIEE